MEDHLIKEDSLLDKLEAYGETSLKLLKLETVEKTADVSSSLISRLFLMIAIILFIVMLSIAVALWIGDYYGSNYIGFLTLASVYAIAVLILYFAHPLVKSRISNFIILKMLS